MIDQDYIEDVETRGKPITCKYCDKSFKIINKNKKQEWMDNKYICPICNEYFCILPPTERILKYAQDQYLLTRSERDMVEMLKIMYPYIQSLIKKNYAKALKFSGALEYYSNDVVVIITEEYLSKPFFKIEFSFGGFLIHKIRQAIYAPKQRIDQNISLDYSFEDGNNLHEIIADNKKDLIQILEEKEYLHSLHKKIIGLIDEISYFCKNKADDYIRILSVYAYLKKGETAFDKIFQSFNREGKEISLKTLDILKKELLKDIIVQPVTIQKHEGISPKKILKESMILNINNLTNLNWEGVERKR